MKNEEYELVLFAWDTPLRPQAEERNLSSPKGGTGGGFSFQRANHQFINK